MSTAYSHKTLSVAGAACEAGHSFHLANYTCLDMHVMCCACRAMGCPQHGIFGNCSVFALNFANQLGHSTDLYLIKVGRQGTVNHMALYMCTIRQQLPGVHAGLRHSDDFPEIDATSLRPTAT